MYKNDIIEGVANKSLKNSWIPQDKGIKNYTSTL